MKNQLKMFLAAKPVWLAFMIALAGLLLASCAGSERHERIIWYVSTTGNDDNTCTTPDEACRTVVEAYDRADADDQINIAAGTYNEVGRYEDYPAFPNLDFDLQMVGAGAESTVIDLGNLYAGFYLVEGGRLRLENLTVRNARGNSPGGCAIVYFGAMLDAENVNFTRCLYAAILIDAESQANLIDVSITESITREPYGAGAGINNRGNLNIQGGEISRNSREGIYSTGILEINGTLIEDNFLEGLSISGGESTLSGVTVQNNAGNMGHFDGIKIQGDAVVSLTDSLITDNNARGIHIYGEDPFNPPTDGLPAAGPSVSIQNSEISNHEGDGLFIAAGTLALDRSTLQSNATNWGRAIDNREALVEVRNSHITGNNTGTIRIGPDGEMNIFETTIDENFGDYPTIFNEGTMNIQNTLVANNMTTLRAIENYGGDMLIANSTISGNGATGIVAFQGNFTLSYVTVTGNSGMGLAASTSGEIRLLISNSLFVENALGDCNLSNPDAPVPILTGVNIATDHFCTFPLMYTTDEILLGALADNGGPTFTHALLPGSPARDVASGICLEVDQRLNSRPVGPACDVGAYEAEAVATSLEATPTPDSEITVTITQDARCRIGPDFIYPDYDFFTPGQTTTVHGRSVDSNWYYVQALSFSGKCFIGKAVLQFNVDPEVLLSLPVIQAPPTPTPTLDPDEGQEVTPTHTPAPKPTACPTLINKPGSCK